MACCTTISPVSSPKKRGASSMFELPRSAKRRRPGAMLGTTMLTTLNQVSDHPLTTTSSSIFNFANYSNNSGSGINTSCFDVNVPFNSPSRFSTAEDPDSSSSSSSSDTDDIMHRIKKEAKRLLKRKQEQQQQKQQQQQHLSNSQIDSNNNTSSKGSVEEVLHKAKLESTATNLTLLNVKRREVPLFTMSQVNAICEKMVKEREAAIREQYDKILAQKLNEQYDAFVKFTHEQIQRRFESSQCSYVS